MTLFRNSADFLELAGNGTIIDRKITVVYLGDSFESPPLKKGDLGVFLNGDKKTHLATFVQRGDFKVLN